MIIKSAILLQELTYQGDLMVNFKGIEGKSIKMTLYKDISSSPSKISSVQIKACVEGNVKF